jgi:hypothetical protein
MDTSWLPAHSVESKLAMVINPKELLDYTKTHSNLLVY